MNRPKIIRDEKAQKVYVISTYDMKEFDENYVRDDESSEIAYICPNCKRKVFEKVNFGGGVELEIKCRHCDHIEKIKIAYRRNGTIKYSIVS